MTQKRIFRKAYLIKNDFRKSGDGSMTTLLLPPPPLFVRGGLSSDKAAKAFYMTLQDYVIKNSGDFMEQNYSLYIPTLPKLIAIDIVLNGFIYIFFLVCYVFLQEHMIIWSCDYMGRRYSW